MARVYRVTIRVEELDEEGEPKEVDVPLGPLAEFYDEDDAVDYATQVQDRELELVADEIEDDDPYEEDDDDEEYDDEGDHDYSMDPGDEDYEPPGGWQGAK